MRRASLRPESRAKLERLREVRHARAASSDVVAPLWAGGAGRADNARAMSPGGSDLAAADMAPMSSATEISSTFRAAASPSPPGAQDVPPRTKEAPRKKEAPRGAPKPSTAPPPPLPTLDAGGYMPPPPGPPPGPPPNPPVGPAAAAALVLTRFVRCCALARRRAVHQAPAALNHNSRAVHQAPAAANRADGDDDDDDDAAMVTREGLRQSVLWSVFGVAAGEALPRARAEAAYAELDLDRSGGVSVSEFAASVSGGRQGDQESLDVAALVVAVFDDDGDGEISRGEFIDFLCGGVGRGGAEPPMPPTTPPTPPMSVAAAADDATTTRRRGGVVEEEEEEEGGVGGAEAEAAGGDVASVLPTPKSFQRQASARRRRKSGAAGADDGGGSGSGGGSSGSSGRRRGGGGGSTVAKKRKGGFRASVYDSDVSLSATLEKRVLGRMGGKGSWLGRYFAVSGHYLKYVGGSP